MLQLRQQAEEAVTTQAMRDLAESILGEPLPSTQQIEQKQDDPEEPKKATGVKKDMGVQSGPEKIRLRKSVMAALQEHGVYEPLVLESHGGTGQLWRSLYVTHPTGIVIEKNGHKAAVLANQRPGWRVYEGDSVRLLKAGLGKDMPITLFDCDPYGDPWGCLVGYFALHDNQSDVLGIAVTDGLRMGVRRGASWHTKSLKEIASEVGNSGSDADYLRICRRRITRLGEESGYKLESWTAYSVGRSIALYGGVLTR